MSSLYNVDRRWASLVAAPQPLQPRIQYQETENELQDTSVGSASLRRVAVHATQLELHGTSILTSS